MATKTDAASLVDVMTRHQVYLEGLKLHEGVVFDSTVKLLRRDLRALFFDLDSDDLSRMTRRQLDLFLRKLRRAQLIHFNAYTQQVIRDLKRFTDIDTTMNADMLRETQDDDKHALAAIAFLLTPRQRLTVWATVTSLPVPANGLLVDDYLAQFTAVSLRDVELAVRRGHASKLSVDDTLRTLLGTSKKAYRDGVVQRMRNHAAGMSATLLQHAAGIVQQRVAAVYYERYSWLSILDGYTSDICRKRHKRVYSYGDGPLPPAHPWCRSKTVPLDVSDKSAKPDTFYGWIRQQPSAVQNDILGRTRAQGVRSGAVGSADIRKFNDAKPLTISGFKDKLRLILAT